MTTSTQIDTAKHLTLVYRITSPTQQTKLLAEEQWVANTHSDAIAERDALQRRVNSMGQKIERLQQRLINVSGYHQAWAAHAQELEKQLETVGGRGVEPLRRAKCLHQITEPAQQEQKPVAWRGSPAPHFLGRYQYTNIGLQAEAWEKQGLQVEPLFATPQPIPSIGVANAKA